MLSNIEMENLVQNFYSTSHLKDFHGGAPLKLMHKVHKQSPTNQVLYKLNEGKIIKPSQPKKNSHYRYMKECGG